MLEPKHDRTLLDFGIGFTDVVKKPSANAAGLTPDDYATWAPRLVTRLKRYRPRVACFHGLTAYRPFATLGLGLIDGAPALGAQTVRIGATRIFVVPNPSPANAHFTVRDQTDWYDRLAEFVDR
jgi:double-stranded uracil-DNA glycosylase